MTIDETINKDQMFPVLEEDFDEISNDVIEEALQGLVDKGFVKREVFESGETYYSLTDNGQKVVNQGGIIIEDW